MASQLRSETSHLSLTNGSGSLDINDDAAGGQRFAGLLVTVVDVNAIGLKIGVSFDIAASLWLIDFRYALFVNY